jgi:hypothetical protein
MHAAEHAERFEDAARGGRALAPVMAGEHLFGHALAGAEAVVAGTSSKTAFFQARMDATTVARREVGAGDSGGFVEGKLF